MMVEVEDVRAWVDGELDEHHASDVARAVVSDQRLTQASVAMRASQLPYRDAYDQIPVPELPESLRGKIQALQSPAPAETKKSSFSMIGIAASVLLAATVGYMAGTFKQATNPDALTSNSTDTQPHAENFAQTVAAYQAFYVRETLEGADNSPAAVAALTERLARQTGMEVIIPALEGYEFIRGQRLSFNGEPLLQLVYLGAEGAPLALCYMPTQQADTDTAVVQRHHGLNTVEWNSNGRRFVIVSGDASDKKLDTLSQSAKQQWSI